MGAGSFPGVKSGRGVTLTPHPLLVPWSWKRRAIPLLPLWAVHPVQSPSACTGCTLPYLSACTRVYFTLPQCPYKVSLYLTSMPVQGCTLPYLSACTRVHFTLPQCLYKGALYLYLQFKLHFFPSLMRYSLFDTLLDYLADLSREKSGKFCVIVLNIPLITVVNFVKSHWSIWPRYPLRI